MSGSKSKQEFLMASEDHLLKLGRSISERMPPDQLAEWAGQVLITAVRAFRSTPVVDELVAVVSDANSWHQCKELFETIRLETLAREREGASSVALVGLLLLAENVAKTLYNVDSARAVFRADASAWIPHCIHTVCSGIGDKMAKAELIAVVLSPLEMKEL